MDQKCCFSDDFRMQSIFHDGTAGNKKQQIGIKNADILAI